MVLVNVGCGRTWHPEWFNFDIRASMPHVRPLDVRRPLPFADRSVDAVYHSHVLEHLERDRALSFTRECRRILKPGGILRAVVPDLESIARQYLQSLEEALTGGSEFKYDWAMIELYDQEVRQARGGEVAMTIAHATPEQKQYLHGRIGFSSQSVNQAARLLELFRDSPAAFWAEARQRAPGVVRNAATDAIVGLLCGRQVLEHVRIGRFRTSGEVHLWMYDRFSLVRLLEGAGFAGVTTMMPGESRIPDFSRFNLELEGGSVRKPDSLFVEGVLR